MSTQPSPVDGPESALTPQRRLVGLRVHDEFPVLAMGDGILLQQIIDAGIAAIPGCSRWFSGVTRYAGQTVPVFDMAAWLGLNPATGKPRHVVVIESNGHRFGVLATQSPSLLDAGVAVRPWQGTPALHPLVASPNAAAWTLEFRPFEWLASVAPGIAQANAASAADTAALTGANPTTQSIDSAFEGNSHVQ